MSANTLVFIRMWSGGDLRSEASWMSGVISQRGAERRIAHHTPVWWRVHNIYSAQTTLDLNSHYTIRLSLIFHFPAVRHSLVSPVDAAGAARPSFICSHGAVFKHELAVSRWEAQQLATGSCQSVHLMYMCLYLILVSLELEPHMLTWVFKGVYSYNTSTFTAQCPS